MEEHREIIGDIFSQDGVLITGIINNSGNYLNTTGRLSIVGNANGTTQLNWKQSTTTVHSDIQDHDWNLVNTIEETTLLVMDNLILEDKNEEHSLTLDMEEIKKFQISPNKRTLKFTNENGDLLISFLFQQGNCSSLVGTLKSLFSFQSSATNENLYSKVDDKPDVKTPVPTTSSYVLDMPSSSTSNFLTYVNSWLYDNSANPVVSSPSTTCKISSNKDEDHSDKIQFSTFTQGDVEVVTEVPKLSYQANYPFDYPLTKKQWNEFRGPEGEITNVEDIKLVIFKGGISPTIRKEVWKYLLEYYLWGNTTAQQQNTVKKLHNEYFEIKLQWKTKLENKDIDLKQKSVEHLVQLDVIRTDRTVEYYSGDQNPNLDIMFSILMSYTTYNFELGYVQGMSDLLSPILYLLDDEVEAFWCFVGFMNKLNSHFDFDNGGVNQQLSDLYTLLKFVEPELATYFDKHDCSNMLFCFQWLLLWFKRQLSMNDVIRLWEILWTDLPCKNFQLLICAAILGPEKNTIVERNYDFAEITKHIQDKSGSIDILRMIKRADEMYQQISTSKHLINPIKVIIGLPIEKN